MWACRAAATQPSMFLRLHRCALALPRCCRLLFFAGDVPLQDGAEEMRCVQRTSAGLHLQAVCCQLSQLMSQLMSQLFPTAGRAAATPASSCTGLSSSGTIPTFSGPRSVRAMGYRAWARPVGGRASTGTRQDTSYDRWLVMGCRTGAGQARRRHTGGSQPPDTSHSLRAHLCAVLFG